MAYVAVSMHTLKVCPFSRVTEGDKEPLRQKIKKGSVGWHEGDSFSLKALFALFLPSDVEKNL